MDRDQNQPMFLRTSVGKVCESNQREVHFYFDDVSIE